MVSVAAAPARARARVSVRNGSWRMAGALIMLVAAVSTSLIGLISGVVWWFTMVGIAALILLTAAALRTLGVSRVLAPILCTVELAIVLTALFGPSSALAGIVPTPGTISQFGDLLARAWVSVEQQATPAQSLTEFMFLVAMASGVIAILLDAIAIGVRKPALTGLILAIVLTVPALLLPNGTSPLAIVACAAAFLFVLRTDTRSRRRGWAETGTSLSIGAITIVIALLVGTTAPGFAQIGRQGITASGISIGGGVNPLIDLGQDLRRPAAVTVLRYTTTSDKQPYLRMTSLDQFTGTVWRHRSGTTERVPPSGSIGAAPGISDAVKTKKTETKVQVTNMESGWIPAPYPVTKVRGLNGTWMWDTNDLTVSGVNVSTQGQNYTVNGLDVDPTPAELKNASITVPKSVERDLFVPFDAPAVIHQTALKATQGATSEYDKAVALQNYFQDGEFTYSTDTPVQKSYDGDSMQAIAEFLKVKAGYCVHFASAMAIMARTLGIPARIGMGYLPGSIAGSQGGEPLFEVTSDDLHAWPELYFSGIGWVPFEPTVSRGSLPAYTVVGGTVDQDEAGATPDAVPTSAAIAPDNGDGTTSAEQDAVNGQLTAIVSSIGIGVFIFALLLLPAAIRRGQRINRLKRLRDDWGSPALAWRELKQTTRDLGMAAQDTETPRAFAARIADLVEGDPAATDALALLLDATEREEYGRPGHGRIDPDRAGQLAKLLAVVLDRAGAIARVRAFLIPVSLLPDPGRTPIARARMTA